MNFNDRDRIIALTPQWKGERLPDGRPKVADKYLDALYGMTLEEVWKPIFVLGYEHQFVGGGLAPLQTLHNDGRKLVGHAVTCTFCPTRPDLHELQFARGAEDGRSGNYNQWVIDSLLERDVVVCDMYDKIYKGTFLGGNLTTAVKKRTGNGGAVIWGGTSRVKAYTLTGERAFSNGSVLDKQLISAYSRGYIRGRTEGKAVLPFLQKNATGSKKAASRRGALFFTFTFAADTVEDRALAVNGEAVVVENVLHQLHAHITMQVDQLAAFTAFEVQMVGALGVAADILKKGGVRLLLLEFSDYALGAKPFEEAVKRAFADADLLCRERGKQLLHGELAVVVRGEEAYERLFARCIVSRASHHSPPFLMINLIIANFRAFFHPFCKKGRKIFSKKGKRGQKPC